MRNFSQEEIDAFFRLLGLATEEDRRRFRFAVEEEPPSRPEQEQVFIRSGANTVPTEEEHNAKLA